MFMKLVSKVVGTKNERELKRIKPMVTAISELEPKVKVLSDDDLRGKTAEFRERIAQGATVDQLLVEAFAVVREAGRRVLGMRHFDVQMLGGIVLHEGKIAEMATGEGKTLVATLPVYLNALEGKGVHVVTVNDYLAKRDSQWMGGIYRFLGLSVGLIQHDMDDAARKLSYGADVTYGTNNEYGFDYLRDNMKFSAGDFAQRELHYSIVDEVDSILVDEARTPLIISGPAEESTEKYYQIDRIIPRLKQGATIVGGKMYEAEAQTSGDYIVDEKAKSVALTETGVAKVEGLLGITNLYDPAHMDLVHHVQQGLRAHVLYKRDVDYVVKDGEVVIVDEFTGRLMAGRRWSDGLHQAVEAKERVKIERENQTLATITFQNYFRMYKKLAGMTGTADTEAAEFAQIYNLDVIVIPTNQPMVRANYPDVIYKSEREKYDAVVEEIAESYNTGRPVLVGTTSIEKNEKLSALLKRKGIPHQVLNAKHHEREAEIVAQAGRFKTVTIATNMAGRGTDILLGGNPKFRAAELLGRGETVDEKVDPQKLADTLEEVRQMQHYGLLDLAVNAEEYAAALTVVRKQTEAEHQQVVASGGLHIIGTERHEARRIDNQLRGRAGRQGDPGSSRFYMSLEDDLLRLFGSDRISGIMEKLGMEEGEPIEHSMVSRAVETAQKRVEAHNFEIRKHLLEYDDVMNTQRKIIYAERRKILEGESLRDTLAEMQGEVIDGLLALYANAETYPEQWDLAGLTEAVKRQFDIEISWSPEEVAALTVASLRDSLEERVLQTYEEREAKYGSELMRYLERMVMLQVVDGQWKDHLLAMDHLKEGIGLRGYGQKDPLIEYKREGFQMFEAMVERIKEQTIEYLYRVQVAPAEALAFAGAQQPPSGESVDSDHPLRSQPEPQPKPAERSLRPVTAAAPIKVVGKKIGRNDPCPCGSGQKYKKCCGA
ncbi:preprotein translocase subunit SecA [Candidatus Methylomirabilis lanthanidiphila]|uniref:Protein translocase subunit SecA n=1 Tax=Candidatus Methylomirabilis lanthanidiphila TaxID=2211376 RepID=A0A564ZIR3_9BACT|nr:preprotein translocase subunit SecA [Candidatus Methylomirabilis lanthanidiphila]VUZ85240.1 preprotein translocase subunit SecA [Candidatus Methylomirabilis lanthanidiphila]